MDHVAAFIKPEVSQKNGTYVNLNNFDGIVSYAADDNSDNHRNVEARWYEEKCCSWNSDCHLLVSGDDVEHTVREKHSAAYHVQKGLKTIVGWTVTDHNCELNRYLESSPATACRKALTRQTLCVFRRFSSESKYWLSAFARLERRFRYHW